MMTFEQKQTATARRRQQRQQAGERGRCTTCVTREAKPGCKTCDKCLAPPNTFVSRCWNVCCQASGFHRLDCVLTKKAK
jgi:hypothetical protein